MLKKFKEEQIDASAEIAKEIDAIVDKWASEELMNKIVSPTIAPDKRRGLWDRFKGGLSNIWYGLKGGRYNPENPYYWKNRFGDDLGVKESFNPAAFTIKEYKEIRSAIETTEQQINESLPPGADKLRIVQIIKQAAENLKKQLKDIFARKCDVESPSSPVVAQNATNVEPTPLSRTVQEPVAASSEEPRASSGLQPRSRRRRQVEPATPEPLPVQATANKGPESEAPIQEPELSSQSDVNAERPENIGPFVHLSPEKREQRYQMALPKEENKDLSSSYLMMHKQIVDGVLASDFEKSMATEKLLNILKWVKDKAEGKEEEKIINKTKRAVEKVEKVIEGNT